MSLTSRKFLIVFFFVLANPVWSLSVEQIFSDAPKLGVACIVQNNIFEKEEKLALLKACFAAAKKNLDDRFTHRFDYRQYVDNGFYEEKDSSRLVLVIRIAENENHLVFTHQFYRYQRGIDESIKIYSFAKENGFYSFDVPNILDTYFMERMHF